MVRRNQADRRAERALQAEMERFFQGGTWTPPPTSECDVHTIVTEPDATTLVVDRQSRWHGQLVEYAVVLKVLDGDDWREVVCIDTSQHGCVHRHRGSHDDAPWVMIRPIRSQLDVNESWNASWTEIWDEYERLDQEDSSDSRTDDSR